MQNNKDTARIIKKGLVNVELYEIIFAISITTDGMAMASGGGRLVSDDSDQDPNDITMATAPLSGKKRPCVFEIATQKAKTKEKLVAGGNENVDNLVSLMSKNQ